MAYERIIELYDTDATTLLETISNGKTDSKVKNCSFELLRKGGCGQGQLELTYPFTTRTITSGMHIKCKYDSSTTWYFGRVEEVDYSTPSGATVRMYGLWSYVNDEQAGGYAEKDTRKPHRYGKTDAFINDPDYSQQSADSADQPDQVVSKIYDQYIQPTTPITKGTIEASGVRGTSFTSMVFRGEESVSQIVRTLATMHRGASYGVDENGDFFMLNRNDTLLKTYQEGVDLQALTETDDRSPMYNKIVMTGGYVYGADTPAGFYRYQAKTIHKPSVTAYGEKKINLNLPWIRTHEDLRKFSQGFFDDYAGITKRYRLTTIGQSTLLKPWAGRIRVLDVSGTTLVTNYFDRVDVSFDEVPFFTITIGPEEPQFPEAASTEGTPNAPQRPQRYEVGNPDEPGDGSINQPETLSITNTWDWTLVLPSSSSSAAAESSSSTLGRCWPKIDGRPLSRYRNYQNGVVQVLGHDSYNCLKWYDVGYC